MSAPKNKLDPLIKTVAWIDVIGLLALGGLAFASSHFKWERFWPSAGGPFATTLAALAAISAAAIALHNGRSQLEEVKAQREQDQTRYEEQRDRDQEQREQEQMRYQEQRTQDQARYTDQRRRDDITDLRKRFAEIANQLAERNPAVRLSGAYAMSALSQDWADLGFTNEVKVCMSVLASYVAAPNPSMSGDEEQGFDAGVDGPVRALIVALLSKDAGSQFQDLWGNYTLLHYADLRGVAFTAPINNADLFRADLRGASFKRAPYMDGIQMSGAKLVRADLSQANLEFANLMFADLTGADMTGVMLNGACLRNAILTDVTMPTCMYDKRTMWPDGFTPPPHPLGEVPEASDNRPRRYF